MHRFIKLTAGFLLAMTIVACGSDKGVLELQQELAEIEAEIGAISEIDCPLKITGEQEGETYACGIYTVPLDYDNPQGDSINLTYMVLRATGADPLPDPIVFLAGGPGQSGVVSAGGGVYGDLRQGRDLIFPAQRGTLFSHRLALDECVAFLGEEMSRAELTAFAESFGERDTLDRSLAYDDYLARYGERAGAINARCHEAFGNGGLDPTQFTTANSANDLVGLMAALGYDSYNLHGTSYGTRLALETVRRHPDANIRSVVLDSPSAPSSDRLAHLATANHDVVMRLFDVCAADADCGPAYPNLTQRTIALLERLANQPLTAGDQSVGAEEFIAQLTDLTNTRPNYMPRMIAELEAGDTTTYLALQSGEVGAVSPGGSLTSPAIDQLIGQISAAAATGGNPLAGLAVVAEITGAVVEENPRQAMRAAADENLKDAEELPQILESIDGLTDEDLAILAGLFANPAPEVDEDTVARRSEATAKNDALFMLSGIVCSEQLSFSDVAEALDRRESLAIPELGSSDAFLATEVGNCTNYPMGDVDPTYNEPVSTAVPILILQGEFDTRTPIQNGLALADQLEAATLVIVPQAGHETWAANNCAGEIGMNFLRNPDPVPDLSCLEIRQEDFSLPSEPLQEPGG